MAIAVVSVSTHQIQSSGASLSVNMPGSLVSGNLLVAILRTSVADTVTAPTNWTKKTSNGGLLSFFYKYSNGSETATSFGAASSGSINSAVVVQLSGTVPSGDPFDTTPNIDTVGASTTSGAPTQTTTTNDCLLLWHDYTSATRTMDTGPTPGTWTDTISGQADPKQIHLFHRILAAAGAVSGTTGHFTVGSLHNTGMAAIKPATGSALTGDVSQTVTATVTSAATVTKNADATLTVTAGRTAAATRNAVVDSSLTVTAGRTATATHGHGAAASLTATATVTASADIVSANQPNVVSISTPQTGTADTLAVDMPPSLVSGNLLVAITRSSNTMAAAPAGWTAKLADSDNVSIYYKYSNGSETATTFSTVSGSEDVNAAVVIQFSNTIGSGDPFDTTPDTSLTATSEVTTSAVAITTVTNNVLLAYFDYANSNRTVAGGGDPSAGGTWDDSLSGVQADPKRIHVWDKGQASAGATGSVTSTYTATTGHNSALFAIKPPATGGLTGDVTLTETATVTSAGTVNKNADSTLTVTADRTAAAIKGLVAAATLTETVAITASGTKGHVAAASLSATANRTAAASQGHGANSTLTETATITASGTRNAVVASSLTETTTITATAAKGLIAAASLAVAAGITASATVTKQANTALTETATVTSSASRGQAAAASLTATATISATATVTGAAGADADFTITASRTTAGVVNKNADAALTVTADRTATATRGLTGDSTLGITAGITSTASLGKTAVSSVPIVAGFTVDATTGRFVDASLTSVATITATATASSDVPIQETVAVSIVDLSRVTRAVDMSRTTGVTDHSRTTVVREAT